MVNSVSFLKKEVNSLTSSIQYWFEIDSTNRQVKGTYILKDKNGNFSLLNEKGTVLVSKLLSGNVRNKLILELLKSNIRKGG